MVLSSKKQQRKMVSFRFLYYQLNVSIISFHNRMHFSVLCFGWRIINCCSREKLYKSFFGFPKKKLKKKNKSMKSKFEFLMRIHPGEGFRYAKIRLRIWCFFWESRIRISQSHATFNSAIAECSLIIRARSLHVHVVCLVSLESRQWFNI